MQCGTPRAAERSSANSVRGSDGRKFPLREGVQMIRLSGLALLASLGLLFPSSLTSQPPRSHRDAASLEGGRVPGCAGFVDEAAGGSSTAAHTSARHGFDLANLDRSVSPRKLLRICRWWLDKEQSRPGRSRRLGYVQQASRSQRVSPPCNSRGSFQRHQSPARLQLAKDR